MKNPIKIILAAMLATTSHTYADPLSAVEDVKLIEVAKEQIQHMKEQQKILENTQTMMQSHHGYASLFEKQTLTDWQHSGKDWSSLMDSHKGAGSDPLTLLAKQIEQEFPVKSSGSIFGNQHSEQARLFDLLAKTTVASRAANTLAYNNIDEELGMLEALQREIEKSQNEKATLDLIARINIESAKLAAYKIKSDAVSAELASLKSQQEVSDAKWASEFFKWP